jgi:WD40 repeat protein/serine/threonine protein kinase
MDQERWKQIDAVFEQMLEIEPGERSEALARMCVGDDALRMRVEALLKQEEPAEDFLKSSAIDGMAGELASELSALTPEVRISHYLIKEQIGAGGMGEVWRAWDEQLKRDVAIKILPPEFSADADRVRRFEQEAYAVSALNHPNIITIYDFGRSGGLQFIVTELIEGRTLRAYINDPMRSWRDAVLIATQVAGALNAAHTVGIVHRDIKPENIMVLDNKHVKALDFGIAKWVNAVAAGVGGVQPAAGIQTMLGARPGTLKYMSPEQARQGTLDARTDVFSLGLVLYEMIAGRHPYGGKNHEEIIEALKSEDEIPPVSEVNDAIPAELDRIVVKALRKRREERYSSGGEILADLERLKSLIEVGGGDKEEKRIRAENADQLLTQFVVFHDADPKTRIPLTAQWTIRRSANLKRGKLERELIRKSLVNGLTKAFLWVLLVAAVTMVAAALMSVREEFTEKLMSDGHTAAVRRAAFSPDGRLLVSVGEDKQVIVWDFARRERLRTFKDHTDWIASVAFSPDGNWFATASYDKTVIVWDATRLEKAAVLRDHREKVCAVAFSPDARLLASSGHQSESQDDGTVLWQVGSWEKVGVIPCGADDANNLLFSPDSRRLIFHKDDRRNTWDLRTGQPLANEFDPAWYGNCAVFSPDGKRLVSVNAAGEVIFVDWQRRSIFQRYPAHQDNGRAAAWSPDGQLVATGAENVILWDGATMRKIAPLEHSSVVWGLAFSPDGRWLISTHGDGAVLVWDILERRRAANFNEHSDSVRAVAFAHDGRRIASASEDRSVIVWDATTGRKETTLAGHTTRVTGVAFAPGGDWLASLDREGKVIVWDLAQRQPRLKFTDPWEGTGYGGAECLAVSPDGRWVVVSHGVYESATGRQVVGFQGHHAGGWRIAASNIYGAAFSVDGRWMVLAEAHGKLLLWDTVTWRIADQADIAPSQLISVSFSPDGQWLATGEDQGAVRLWSARPLRQVAEVGRHAARVKSVAFSPDGKEVVSASDDKAICLWDVGRRKLITRIGTHTSPVLSVAFSPEGKQIISGEHDHSVRLYTRHRALWGWRWD